MKETDKIKIAENLVKEILDLASEKDEQKPNLDRYAKQQREDLEKLIHRLNDEERTALFFSKIAQIDGSDNKERMMKKLQRATKTRRRQRLFSASAVAAAVLLISMTIWQFDQKSSEIRIVASIDHEIKKPTLIMESGESICLEDTLTTTHYFDVTKQELSYHITDAANEVKYNELVIPAKYTYTLKLSDGSRVIMNAGSRLKFPVNFSGDTRSVELSGEAYFEVAKSEKPFIVKTTNVSIRVYGTEFNINATDEKMEAILVTGSIGASINGAKEIMMKPNQLLSYHDNNYSLCEVDAAANLQWMEGCFKYVNKPLADVLNDFAQWYGVEFRLKEEVRNLEVTMFSIRDVELHDLLKLIEEATKLKFIKEENMKYSVE